ncbi:MAG: hypothetical protein V1829_01745 [bacterium]
MLDKKTVFQIFALVLLLIWYGLFFANKVDLTVVDLGRHLENGQMVLQGNFDVLKTNFYSYTQPDYPVVNHHWLSGVIFFLIWHVFGFAGLSLFYLVISLIIFYIFFRLAQKQSSFKIAFFVSILLIPLIASRAEIRPEIFSYFFISIFFWILWHHRQGLLSFKYLFILPVLGILWVNTHIYFIFGLFLIGLFLFEKIVKKLFIHRSISFYKDKQIKNLGIVFFLTAIVSCINPFGLKGVLYPFNIFRSYGYRIIENQSVWFLENLGFIRNPNLLLFKIVFFVLLLSFILVLIRKRKSFSLIYFSLAVLFSVMAWTAIRNFTLFGFFALLIIAFNIKNVLEKEIKLKSFNFRIFIVFIGLAIFLISIFTHNTRLPFEQGEFGFGLKKNNSKSAEFFKKENIQGSIFNNYDIGGYLIFYFYPDESVFVDNRPEAYSVPFFKEIYIPIQDDNSIWNEQDKIYDFNAIFFSHRDATPWAQKFLNERINDSLWAPVFVDEYSIIFLKRNNLNQAIIDKYGF